jgi:hypothetical protein
MKTQGLAAALLTHHFAFSMLAEPPRSALFARTLNLNMLANLASLALLADGFSLGMLTSHVLGHYFFFFLLPP